MGIGGLCVGLYGEMVDVCEIRSSSAARRSRERSVVMDMSVVGRSLFGGVMGWFAFGFGGWAARGRVGV